MPLTLPVEVEPISETVDSYKVIEAASWRSPARTYIPQSDYRFMVLIAPDESSYDIGGFYEEAFGLAPLGTLIPVRACTINSVSGMKSSWIYATAIVVPP